MLEYCGDSGGHVWKQLEPLQEEHDAIIQPKAKDGILNNNVYDIDDETMVSFTVKFYYTKEFAETTEDIDGFLDLVIAETNQGFANSGINLKVINFFIES